ncbi:MAG TPA: hypothetical protein VMF11_09580 [Candidatus Baltobacteraceae bacterium]|nr:hypothetical protein [Candidatus Baltobacteraceae bacterium]
MATRFARAERSISPANLRARATQVYALFAWLHVPAVAAIALAAHNGWLGPVMLLAEVATFATVCALTMKDGILLRSIMAVALTLGPIFFVYAGRGGAIDYHGYYFVALAMLAAYVDWRPIAIASLLAIGLAQVSLGLAALQGVYVLAECSMLVWITYAMQMFLNRVDDLMNFTAEAIAGELAEKASLQAEISRLRHTA